jgi:hypothetical protein
MSAPETVFVRGSGGALFEMDVPTRGHALERYTQALAKGDLSIVAVAHWVTATDGSSHLVEGADPAAKPAKADPKPAKAEG